MSNLCTRCGNERIASKTWEEIVEVYGGESIVTHTEFVCADQKCQKMVEKQLREQREKREYFEKQKELDKQRRAQSSAWSKLHPNKQNLQ